MSNLCQKNLEVITKEIIYENGIEYLARSLKSLASTLQLLIDKYKDTSKLLLILCGSSMSYMEDHVLAYKAPLYGRRTAQIKLLPLDFEEVCVYFRNLSNEDKALIYGIAGGCIDKANVMGNVKLVDYGDICSNKL